MKMFDRATPRPWYLSSLDDRRGTAVLYVTDGACSFGKDVGYFPNKYDAALSGCAPDFLEALQAIASSEVRDPASYADTVLAILSSRIAAQTGEADEDS